MKHGKRNPQIRTAILRRANSTSEATRFIGVASVVSGGCQKVIQSGRWERLAAASHYTLLRPIKPGNVQTDNPHRPEVSGHWNVSLTWKAESDRPEVFGRDKVAVQIERRRMITDTTGPIYGVTLLDTLPLGKSGMMQAMPTRKDLERVQRLSERTVAGFEVLTEHYRHQVSETNRLTLLIRNVIEGNWNVTELAEAIGYL